MSEHKGYVIGIRLNPDRPDAEWYTLWYEHDEGPNRIVTNDGRMQWSSSVHGAHELAVLLPNDVSLDPVEPSVCDVACMLHDIANGSTGNEALVLDSLNFLDDLLITVHHTLPKEPKLRLDRVSGRLTEGISLPDVIAAHDGANAVLEAILASLGRVLVWSDFACDG